MKSLAGQEARKSHRILLWLAIVFMLLTAAAHSISLFITVEAQNETEKQLLTLMSGYRFDLGGGFHRSMSELTKALSSCFTLLCVLGALTDICLLMKGAPANIIKALLGVQVLVFGVCFLVMAAMTFLPPIILSGLDFLTVAMAYALTPKVRSTAS